MGYEEAVEHAHMTSMQAQGRMRGKVSCFGVEGDILVSWESYRKPEPEERDIMIWKDIAALT